jgi:DNA-directed RNA polymerase specialized sigma24 family protein
MEPRSQTALTELVGPLSDYVARRVRYHEALGNLQKGEVEPEDIVALTFLEASRLLRERPPASPIELRWLRRLAGRLLDREVRRLRAERGDVDEQGPRDPRDQIGRLPELVSDAEAAEPDDVAERIALERALSCLLGGLPELLREPLLLLVVDQYEREQVAALEGSSVDQVLRRVERANRRLLTRLGPVYGDEATAPLERLLELVERGGRGVTDEARVRERLATEQAPPPPGA